MGFLDSDTSVCVNDSSIYNRLLENRYSILIGSVCLEYLSISEC